MKKIAFTIFRYGEGIFGGTEAHCRMLAEHLAPYYQVEVLTTTIRYPGCPEQDDMFLMQTRIVPDHTERVDL